MAGRIVVVRDAALSGYAMRFAVRIDGARVGKVRNGGSRDFEVEPGVHRVRVSQTGYASRALVLSVADGETVVLWSRVRFWPTFLSGTSSALVGSSCAWLLLEGLTATRLLLLAVGAAGMVLSFATKWNISLRAEPVSASDHTRR